MFWLGFLTNSGGLPQGTIARFLKSFQAFLAQPLGRGAMVVVSDFLGDLNDILSGFRWLRSRGRDISALQVLDPVELDLSFRGARRFNDLESSDALRADPEGLFRHSYQKLMGARQSALSRGLSALSVDHVLFRTDRPVDEGLAAFFRHRSLRR